MIEWSGPGKIKAVRGTVWIWEFSTRDNNVYESGLVAFYRHTESRDCGRGEREASAAEWC